jgi:hypothetical protein
MNRLGVGLVLAALLLGAGCGGSDGGGGDKSASASPSSSLALLTVDKACAQVQMVNDDIGSFARWPIPTYKEYGEQIATVADQSVPEIATDLTAMSDQALKVGSMSGDDDVMDASSDWATKYQKVADICARTDSPITRLG